ncbi:MAG: hypothetical protein HYV63_34825 [Candidatus Schekmanbacteria bacterium]|nr:hypothetical protein [Candidatus Schekmanbacteria bacterium]
MSSRFLRQMFGRRLIGALALSTYALLFQALSPTAAGVSGSDPAGGSEIAAARDFIDTVELVTGRALAPEERRQLADAYAAAVRNGKSPELASFEGWAPKRENGGGSNATRQRALRFLHEQDAAVEPWAAAARVVDGPAPSIPAQSSPPAAPAPAVLVPGNPPLTNTAVLAHIALAEWQTGLLLGFPAYQMDGETKVQLAQQLVAQYGALPPTQRQAIATAPQTLAALQQAWSRLAGEQQQAFMNAYRAQWLQAMAQQQRQRQAAAPTWYNQYTQYRPAAQPAAPQAQRRWTANDTVRKMGRSMTYDFVMRQQMNMTTNSFRSGFATATGGIDPW